ncbi:hypothetical protein, partial [Metallibacterium scheffleri]|uniref:hypothetical protein n=1 Tax=Metallibacterium scheffleri TaxID=993689 RepID=UPI0023F56BFB
PDGGASANATIFDVPVALVPQAVASVLLDSRWRDRLVGHPEIVGYGDAHGTSALHRLAASDQPHAADAILWWRAQGMDLAPRDAEGRVPMHAAAAGGHVANLVALDCAAPETWDIPDKYGETAMACLQRCHPEEGVRWATYRAGLTDHPSAPTDQPA